MSPRQGRRAHQKRPAEKGRKQRMPAPPGAQWLYGAHAVLAALANPKRRCLRVLATAAAAGGLKSELPDSGPEALEVVTADEIQRVLPAGAIHQGLAALCEPLPTISLDDLLADLPPGPATVLVLDQVGDPQNLGAILRSAAAFGCRAVIVQDRHSPGLSAAVVKVASGGAESVPLVRATNIARALAMLKAAGFWCFGLDVRGSQNLAEADFGDRTAFALGAEGSGLRRLTRETCDALARIPIGDAIDSLNVAAAAAIVLYEKGRRA